MRWTCGTCRGIRSVTFEQGTAFALAMISVPGSTPGRRTIFLKNLLDFASEPKYTRRTEVIPMTRVQHINCRAFQSVAADLSAAAAAGSCSGSCSGWRGMELSSCVSSRHV